MNDFVHQIRYGWSETSLLGTRGMGPVHSTLPEDLLPAWDRHLRDHVWVAGTEPGFTFLVRDGMGALLRKVPATSPNGRQGSAAQVLLGPRLSARAALGLTLWPGWEEPVPGVLDWHTLRIAADEGTHLLRRRARALPADRLARLFAQLLAAPGDGYTVIGEPEPLALTCALGDLMSATPSFASDEPDDVRSDLPTAVFLREAPVSATTVTRRRLDPAAGSSDPVLSSFASAAAEAYTEDGLDGIAWLRRDRPPADADDSRAWAHAAQFAPGVLADLTRLPRLTRAEFDALDTREARARIAAAAAAASSDRLLRALSGNLPAPIEAILLRESVARVASPPGDGALLDRLAELGPLAPELIAERAPAEFGRLAGLTRVLLAPDARREMLESAARPLPFDELIHWVGRYAGPDPGAALAMYGALCARSGTAPAEDLWSLAERGLLIDDLRRIAESEGQVSAWLAALLRSMPSRFVTDPIVLNALLARPDPALLHALDGAVADGASRARIHSVVRSAYYRAHDLPEPAAVRPGDGSAARRIAGAVLRPLNRRSPSNPGKAK